MMKVKRFALLILFLSIVSIIAAQVPVGFNYQGVARDNDGQPLKGTEVQILMAITSGGENGTLIWEEEHTLTTDVTGAFSLILGGNPSHRTGGEVVDFNEIDWAADIHFLSVSINGDLAGSSQLMSVPYAAVAQNVVNGGEGSWSGQGNDLFFNQGNVSIGAEEADSRLTVQAAPGTGIDTALFVVKNVNGDTVFAVYNEGVRINIEEGQLAGNKGGFAIGGYNSAKSTGNEFLRITPDDVQFNIRQPAKAGKGGFAIGGYNSAKAESTTYMEMNPENYFIGYQAGEHNNAGIYNSFFGYQAGKYNFDGSQNIFIGYKAGYNNTDGEINAFIGNHAGYSNTTGHENVFIGDSSGYFNETGFWNVFVGERTGKKNISGRSNVFVGDKAGQDNETGDVNVFIGSIAGWKNVNGNANVFLGSAAGGDNVSGSENTIIGSYAGRRNQTGNTNIFIGRLAGFTNTTGSDNIYIGNRSGALSDTTFSNIFIGNNSGQNNIAGLGNVFLGNRTGNNNIDGSNNTLLGHESGHHRETGYLNTLVGAYAGFQAKMGNRNTFIGANAGTNAEGEGNVFIGEAAGYYESGSNKLYIHNSDADSSGALIYGDFWENILTFNGKVGINTTTPWNDLQVSSTGTFAKLMVGERDSIVGYSEFAGSRSGMAGGSVRLGVGADHDDFDEFWQVSVWGENFQIGTPTNYAWFEITRDGTILHRGSELHADYVFENEYTLESIEEHADFMWEYKHLPAVPPALKDSNGNEVVDLGARNKGVLEELEKAHIYIEQLNDALNNQASMIDELNKEIIELKQKIY